MVSISGFSRLEIRDQTSLSRKLCEEGISVVLVVCVHCYQKYSIRQAIIQHTKNERVDYSNKYVFPKYMFNSAYLP